MKKLLFSLFLLFSFNVFASDILLSYQYGEQTPAHLQGKLATFKVNKIEVFADNSMRLSEAVVYNNHYLLNNTPNFRETNSIELSFHQATVVKEMIKELSQATLTYIVRTRLCEIVVKPYRTVDHLSIVRDWNNYTQTFNGGLELVSTPSGCWMPEEVTPRNYRDLKNAEMLKIVMKFVAR